MSHINEKIDFIVSAYIVHDNKVLLRYHDKSHDWYVPGGHIELDEGPIEALHREVMEEAGLKIKIIGDEEQEFPDGSKDIITPIFINRFSVNNEHEHIDLVYAATSDSTEINPSEGESSDLKHFRWLTEQEIETAEDILPDVKRHALTALKKVQNH